MRIRRDHGATANSCVDGQDIPRSGMRQILRWEACLLPAEIPTCAFRTIVQVDTTTLKLKRLGMRGHAEIDVERRANWKKERHTGIQSRDRIFFPRKAYLLVWAVEPGIRIQRTCRPRDWSMYTENVSPIVASFRTLVPANGHLPLKLGFAFGADKKYMTFAAT